MIDHRLIERPRLGDLVISRSGFWDMPRIVVRVHETAKSLYGTLSNGEVMYVHYKHLKVINESR
jgi:hypothetical protein